MIKRCVGCKKDFNFGYGFKGSQSLKRKYCSHRCYSNDRKGKHLIKDIGGEKNPNWRGGRRIDKDNYVLIYAPYHPFCEGDGYVREHRLIMEKKLKRFLKNNEVVHHINDKRQDNRIENLRVLIKKDHDRISLIKRIEDGTFKPYRKTKKKEEGPDY